MSQPSDAGGQPDPQGDSFEAALEQLEAIVERLESGQLGLSESLAQYESGVRRLRRCYQLLQEAENRIELLSKVDPQGVAESEPFREQDMELEEKRRRRGDRRSITTGESDGSEDGHVDDNPSLF